MIQKSILKSKIFWAAFIPMIVDILNLAMETPVIPEQYRGMLSLLSSVLVIIFRYTSTASITPIATKKQIKNETTTDTPGDMPGSPIE